ncbi:MAG: glycosyltransferase, partial [Candidatus Omnitrophica bacterium]|nr:glycosyltransferase [Candidatus Omnitrophota bacterium]
MRILVVSNLYPPYYRGGYELGCRDVVEQLKIRGYQIKVLTRIFGINHPHTDGEVYRWLEFCLPSARFVLTDEIINQRVFRRLCNAFKPDLVFFWNLTHASISCAFLAQKMQIPTCYYIFDNWLATWEMDYWYQAWKHILDRSKYSFLRNLVFQFTSNIFDLIRPEGNLDLRHVIFASEYLKGIAMQVGKPVADAKVIHFGINIEQFPYKRERCEKPKRLLYVGQIVPHKGVHTAIESLALLVKKYRYESLSLTIVGNLDFFPSYVLYLKKLIKDNNLEKRVKFMGFLSREQILSVYYNHDIFLFPSCWDEPFGMVLLEAMSCGLPVVSTATGGSSEILEDGVNALIFPREDIEACALQIKCLLDDSKLFERISQNARQTIENRFQIEPKVDLIEDVLINTIKDDDKNYRRYNKRLRSSSTEITQKEPKSPNDIRCITKTLLFLWNFISGLQYFFLPSLWLRRIKIFIETLQILFIFLSYKIFFFLIGISRKKKKINLSRVKSILIVQLADIEDAVLSSPFLRELRRSFPSAWIGLVVQPGIYNLVEKCPYVNEVFTFDW